MQPGKSDYRAPSSLPRFYAQVVQALTLLCLALVLYFTVYGVTVVEQPDWNSPSHFKTLASEICSKVRTISPASFTKANRARFLQDFRKALPFTPAAESTILILGARRLIRPYSDTEYVFRQLSDFLFLTGYDRYESALSLEVATGKLTLYIPQPESRGLLYDGPTDTPADAMERTKADAARYFPDALADLRGRTVYVLDQSAVLERFPALRNDNSTTLVATEKSIVAAFRSARIAKEDGEVEAVRVATDITSQAHRVAMAFVGSGALKYEYEVESFFRFTTSFCGLRIQAYEPIVGAAEDASVLHWIKNNKPLKPNSLILMDAAVEYLGYASDVTRTFPASGKFDADQRLVYNAVLASSEAALKVIRTGAKWSSVESASRRALLEGLVAAGVLYPGSNVDRMVVALVDRVFFPHGLGHGVGLDVHDPQGNDLVTRQIMTVEPGCYFNPSTISTARKNPLVTPYINFTRVEEIQERVGGVRIEDVVVVRENGYEILGNAPRTVEEVEAVMATRLR